jgi:ribosomal protein S18 acetylase RimI-like enzyme
MGIDFQLQPFETDLLGVPVGRLSLADDGGPSGPEGLGELVAGWRAGGVWLVSCRVAASSAAIEALERNGFKTVESLVTFRRRLSPRPMPAGVEIARADDAEACVAIARRAFVNDRLHRDPRVPTAAADLVRERWMRNDLAGRADASLVVRSEGAIAGFTLCLLDGREAVIDLIAVDIGRQRQRLGRALVEGALARYGGRADTMRVGTQADNEPSLALYRGAGFVEADRRITLHWVNPNVAPALRDDPR